MSPDSPALTPDLVPLASSGLSTLLLLVAGIVLFVFLVQRPMKKQQEAQRKLQESVGEGGRVMLSSGLFGTVRHLGDKQAVVELAPGLEVTVLRQAIARTVAPDDEEFEYADETTFVEDADETTFVDDADGTTLVDGAGESIPTASSETVHPDSEQSSSTGEDGSLDDPERPSSL